MNDFPDLLKDTYVNKTENFYGNMSSPIVFDQDYNNNYSKSTQSLKIQCGELSLSAEGDTACKLLTGGVIAFSAIASAAAVAYACAREADATDAISSFV